MRDSSATSGTGHRCDLLCPVEHIMHHRARFVESESTLRATAQAILDQSGATVVLGPDGPSSIVTERDLVRALALGADPDEVWAGDVASTDLVSVDRLTSIAAAVRHMADEDIRHLPVNDHGEIVGLLAAEDVVVMVATNLRIGHLSS